MLVCVSRLGRLARVSFHFRMNAPLKRRRRRGGRKLGRRRTREEEETGWKWRNGLVLFSALITSSSPQLSVGTPIIFSLKVS